MVANADGSLIINAPMFDGWGWCMEYWGGLGGNVFEAWIPIDCDGCCCDFWLDGEFSDDGSVVGAYHAYDGTCHAEITFRGSR